MSSHGRIPEDRKTGWLALQPRPGLPTHESYFRISQGLNVKQHRHSTTAACVAEISAEVMGRSMLIHWDFPVSFLAVSNRKKQAKIFGSLCLVQYIQKQK